MRSRFIRSGRAWSDLGAKGMTRRSIRLALGSPIAAFRRVQEQGRSADLPPFGPPSSKKALSSYRYQTTFGTRRPAEKHHDSPSSGRDLGGSDVLSTAALYRQRDSRMEVPRPHRGRSIRRYGRLLSPNWSEHQRSPASFGSVKLPSSRVWGFRLRVSCERIHLPSS